MGLVFAPEVAAARAWLMGRELSLLQRFSSRRAARRGVSVPIPAQIQEERLIPALRRLEAPPQNATAAWVNGQVVVSPDRSGVSIPLSEAKAAIVAALEQGRGDPVFLPTRPRPAAVTRKQLAGVRALRASVTVPLTSRHPGARRNASLAAQGLDGAILLPGQTLSLNRRLGERTPGKGYAIAPVFINEQQDLAVGGGICPVCTAVFQGTMLAGLDLVERHPHSRRVRYARPGLDATLNYPRKDLKVRNPTGVPMVLRVFLRQRKIVVQVLGAPQAETIGWDTERRRDGQRLRVTTYRVVNGQRRFLCRSLYRLSREGPTRRVLKPLKNPLRSRVKDLRNGCIYRLGE